MAKFYFILLALVAKATASEHRVYHKEGNSEVPCLAATANYTPCSKADPWVTEHDAAGKPWYYIMANRAHAHLINYILHSDDPAEGFDFAGACMTITRTDKTVDGKPQHGIKMEGFGNCAEFKCSEEHGEKACQPNLEAKPARGDAISKRGTTEATIIWTHKEKYTLGIRCAGATTLWSLRGVEPGPVDADVEKEVLKFIEAFDHSKYNPSADGKKFSEKNAVSYEQKDCKPKPENKN